MKRCLCCGLPSQHPLCGDCATPCFLPWKYTYVDPAWTSVALLASRAEQRGREQVYRP